MIRLPQRRRGVALVMVLVLIVMISLGAYAFTHLMTAQERAMVMMGRRAQARAAVASGVEYIKDYLALLPEDQSAAGGHWDNATYFGDVVVANEPGGIIRFAVISITHDQYGEPTGFRFGLEDLGAKININEVALADRYKADSGSQAAAADNTGSATNAGGAAGGGGTSSSGGAAGGGATGSAGGSTTGGGATGAGATGAGATGAGATGAGATGAGAGQAQAATPSADATTGGVSEDPNATRQRDVLMQLPMMTEMIADAILDWIDEDTEPRDFGAEAESYTLVEPPNGRINSLDELLLVQGVTQELLYGADRNHNGVIDESEQEGATMLSTTNGSMARGWSAFLTVSSKDVLPQIETPVDINQDDLQTLYDELVAAGFDADFATYVVAYRQSGPYTPPAAPQGGQGGQGGQQGGQGGQQGGQGGQPPDTEPPVPEAINGRTVDLTKSGGTTIASVLDLLGSSVQTTFEGENEAVVVMSPYGDDADLSTVLPDLMGALSVGEAEGSGRINLNECTAPVANSIPVPDIDPATIQAILGSQDPGNSSGDVNYLYPTWPLAAGLVTIEEMKMLLPFVSARGVIYRAQVVGFSDVPGAFARAEVVVDASDGVPRVVSWRDLTHLGPGFDLATLAQTQ